MTFRVGLCVDTQLALLEAYLGGAVVRSFGSWGRMNDSCGVNGGVKVFNIVGCHYLDEGVSGMVCSMWRAVVQMGED